ncbi:nucleotidyltransferase family protein [Natrinema gelatinilyticum]|uniref:nucleotidyltransferase family protein n=1 Tax=Natrinema gelatinilyticum TaxID=2961571 RepID=UPI0020C36814|nr:nucleotidyltransferase family protein [Natrinema gelatinilyticum]
MSGSSIPVVEPAAINGRRTSATVHGVLLAAEMSSRFGDANKLLATIEREPIVRRAARSLVRSKLDDVIVVLGHEVDRIREATTDLDVSVVVDESYDRGQSTSVHAGVRAARERDADATLIALGDMPDMMTDSIDATVEAYERDGGNVIAAACDGRRGKPVLFDSQYFDWLTDVSGDVGGRQILLTANDAIHLETGDPGVLRDIDRPEDLPE